MGKNMRVTTARMCPLDKVYGHHRSSDACKTSVGSGLQIPFRRSELAQASQEADLLPRLLNDWPGHVRGLRLAQALPPASCVVRL
ncbi:hypothetical protein [Ensifer sp. B1-9]|uniref:hypothetical protein n=1 Tax=Ensifer sp. B1-9 TaxID=3141455 RepID=UPI003D25A123